MSLLLEALKKAELAKQGRKPADDEAAIQFEPAAPERGGAAEPVITRGQLPDISEPLEILSEDLPSASAQRAAEEAESMAAAPIAATPVDARPIAAAPMAAVPPAPAHRPARATEPELEVEPRSNAENAAPAPMESAGAAERDAARQLFEAKEVEYNPRRNFFITIGVLLAAGAGYGGYVWWQLRPPSGYNVAAVQSAANGTPAPGAQADLAPAVQPPVPPPAAPQAPASPGPSPAAAKAEAAPAQAQIAGPRGPAFTRREAGPETVAAAGSPAPARGPERVERPPITITPPVLAVDPLVERAFESYQKGELAGSRDAYRQVLQREPLNRDALLGLAAIDVRLRSFDTAEARYIKLLELDPRDVNAQAGLIALRGQADPVQSESRLKTLIATSPDATPLHFALGNQYAQQARWAEAQAEYFKAYSGDSENADFAFNLAVSLDQLRQSALALQYYQRAMALAADRTVSFELTQVTTRIQELRRQ
jgi:tetratricopeptide (TPR) repeat protein